MIVRSVSPSDHFGWLLDLRILRRVTSVPALPAWTLDARHLNKSTLSIGVGTPLPWLVECRHQPSTRPASMDTSGEYDICFEDYRTGSIISWDVSSNFVAVELIPGPYPGPLLACILEPRCPQVGRLGDGLPQGDAHKRCKRTPSHHTLPLCLAAPCTAASSQGERGRGALPLGVASRLRLQVRYLAQWRDLVAVLE